MKANKKRLTSVDLVLKDLRSLDEPEPLPFKLKDVVGRIRGFGPTTRTIWLNAILKELDGDYGLMKYRSGYEQGKFEGALVGNQLKDADKIRQKLNKPVTPQFVADWYEKNKDDFEYSVWEYILRWNSQEKSDFYEWMNHANNKPLQTLVNMHQFGYKVEEEKRYIVVMKETKQPLYYNAWDKKLFFSMAKIASHFTKQQLEKLNFGWVFDCEGIEIEEVEE